jgi:hypothetical protein
MNSFQEDVLIEWINFLGMIAQPLHESTIGHYVKEITGHAPGKGWLRRFKKRHEDKIVHCRTSGLDPKCARSFNHPVVNDYFEKLRQVLEAEDIPWENVYNMDEKGAQLGGGRKVRRRKYLFGRSSCQRYRIRSSNLELVTAVECVSADGHTLKPYIIFKGKRLSQEWFTARGVERASRQVYAPSNVDQFTEPASPVLLYPRTGGSIITTVNNGSKSAFFPRRKCGTIPARRSFLYGMVTALTVKKNLCAGPSKTVL